MITERLAQLDGPQPAAIRLAGSAEPFVMVNVEVGRQAEAFRMRVRLAWPSSALSCIAFSRQWLSCDATR